MDNPPNNSKFLFSIGYAIADRLAEALAELMHQRVRKEFWAYASDENLKNDDLIKETAWRN